MNSELLFTGRKFLILLHNIEDKTRASESSYYPSNMVIQIRNWKYVLAFIIRKLSATLEGTTDHEFEIRNPIFILKNENGGTL
jgi:hypothetical protein